MQPLLIRSGIAEIFSGITNGAKLDGSAVDLSGLNTMYILDNVLKNRLLEQPVFFL
jgi:hypothetical protein